MKQRARVKLVCVSVCLASAMLCALHRAPVLAIVQAIAAIVVWRTCFGRTLGAAEVNALISELSDARDARTHAMTQPAMIRGTVLPNIIAVSAPWSRRTRWPQVATVFRDEMTVERWRQLTTALRHQPRMVAAFAGISKTRGG